MMNSTCTTDEFGNKRWYNDKGEFHREGDLPAVEYADGDKAWFLNGKLHRDNGPAIEWSDGTKEWWVDDERVNCTDNDTFLRLVKLKWCW